MSVVFRCCVSIAQQPVQAPCADDNPVSDIGSQGCCQAYSDSPWRTNGHLRGGHALARADSMDSQKRKSRNCQRQIKNSRKQSSHAVVERRRMISYVLCKLDSRHLSFQPHADANSVAAQGHLRPLAQPAQG